mmetsp:Transcript_14183/g.14253  ORF Transcript_14183/g.14253 Transcript_14183/m.14253 type:complete len:298 (+) Transcript_14183:112-1005(+)
MNLGILTFLERNLYPNFARSFGYYFIRTIGLFYISEPVLLNDIKKGFEKIKSGGAGNKGLSTSIDKISEAKSIKELEILLETNIPISVGEAEIHPWATNPTTMSSLTAMRIGMISSENKFTEEDYKEIIKSKILDILLDGVKTIEPAQIDNCLLALSFLSEKSKKIRKHLLRKYAFDALRKCIYDAKTIRASTAARICRNIYFKNFAAQREFIAKGYVEALLRLIKKCESDPTGILEILQGMMDLILLDDDQMNTQSIHLLRNTGLINILQEIDAKHGSRNEVKIALSMLRTVLTSV